MTQISFLRDKAGTKDWEYISAWISSELNLLLSASVALAHTARKDLLQCAL